MTVDLSTTPKDSISEIDLISNSGNSCFVSTNVPETGLDSTLRGDGFFLDGAFFLTIYYDTRYENLVVFSFLEKVVR